MRANIPVAAALLALFLMLGLAGCELNEAGDSKVYQGECLSVGDGGRNLTLANSQPALNPIKGDSATFNIAGAKVGLAPEKGNIIRVAYFKEGDELKAIKVMNVSKQDLRKK